MRDGVKLATNIFLPKGDGPWPVILTRTPYSKDGTFSMLWTKYTERRVCVRDSRLPGPVPLRGGLPSLRR